MNRPEAGAPAMARKKSCAINRNRGRGQPSLTQIWWACAMILFSLAKKIYFSFTVLGWVRELKNPGPTHWMQLKLQSPWVVPRRAQMEIECSVGKVPLCTCIWARHRTACGFGKKRPCYRIRMAPGVYLYEYVSQVQLLQILKKINTCPFRHFVEAIRHCC